MLGQLGDKMESGLKYMFGAQAIQQNLADAVYKRECKKTDRPI